MYFLEVGLPGFASNSSFYDEYEFDLYSDFYDSSNENKIKFFMDKPKFAFDLFKNVHSNAHNDSFDLNAVKQKYLNSDGTVKRVRRQADDGVFNINPRYRGRPLPKIVGNLDRRPEGLFRTSGFVPINLGTFAILSTGATGRTTSFAFLFRVWVF